jgi:SagB-type dehydrogenase family enzyme
MTPTLRHRLARMRDIALKAALVAALLAIATVAAQTAEIILSAPQTEGGKPLMQALKERRTTRSFADQPLAPQQLSNLLWAAFGVNRADGHRTAPSARNWQEIDVYVALASGLYVYDGKGHALRRVLAQDVRALAGTQAHAREAPVTLIYVADDRRMGSADEQTRRMYAAADTGFIAQNVYLYCASEGLGTVVFASIDRERFAQAAELQPEQRIVLAKSVGYPKR